MVNFTFKGFGYGMEVYAMEFLHIFQSLMLYFLTFCIDYFAKNVLLFHFDLSYAGPVFPESSQLPGSHPMLSLSVYMKLYSIRIQKHIDIEIEPLP